MHTRTIGGRTVGRGHPVYVIAEIGINHNGDLNIAKKLIDFAAAAGCDAVKFQKRTPEVCTPPEMRARMRETPWGYISYMDYRHKIEFNLDQYKAIDTYCRDKGIQWFASVWDPDSIDFMKKFDTPCIKIPSASLTNKELLTACKASGIPLMLSTGASTQEAIDAAVALLGTENLLLAHATSTYPCPLSQLNLRMIETLAEKFPCPIGYSGHETGLATTVAAVAIGATFVERHVTLDRAMWGSDQSASVEPGGLLRLLKDIRSLEQAMGDGKKVVYEEEKKAMERLRFVNTLLGS
jgi:N-acetylneuraminate synthase